MLNYSVAELRVKMIIFFILISFVVNFGAKLRYFQTLSKEVGSNSLIL